MRLALKEWLLLGIGVLVIGTLVFGTMYSTIQTKTTEMENTVKSTNLPGE